MRTNRELALAIKRALATGTIALCGAGALAAYAQPTPAPKATATQTTTKRTTTAKATAAKATTASAPIVLAQTTPAPAASGPSPQQLQTIVITGSLIERTATESPNPVQVISAKDLVQSGYTDISDVLRNISANGASTLSQSFSFAFAAGASGISLRGLSLGDTLVLIDGERSVPYPLLDDNERSFVDLSSIPFTAIQQVQVLKDGASALYGADAVAGVVNVILRKEYQGFHLSTEAGTSQHWDGTQEHVGFIGGRGDLASDGYNWYVSGDLRHQDSILAANRSGQWDSLDFNGYGGYNRTPGVSLAENPNIPYPNVLTGYLINPNSTDGTPYTYLPGCDATSEAVNRCSYFPAGAQLQPATTNVDVLGKFTKELGGGWELGVQASWFYSRADQVSSYNGDISAGGGTGYADGGPTNIGLAPGQAPNVITYPLITVPTNYPGNINTYGAPAPLVYSFPELGLTNTQVDTNTYRLLASISGNAAGWDISGTAGAMYAKMDQWLYGNIEPSALQNALNNGYILGSSTGTSLFAPPAQTTPTSQLDLIDVHGTHKLFDLPGGPLNFAIGAQWFKEEHDETPPPLIESGVQAGDSIYVIGTEYDRAAFAELDGNPVKSLNINIQGRYDNYQTFGSDITPKIGFKYTPFKWIAVRGTWGKGFRVPSAAEGISSGEAFGAGTSNDPVLCPNPTTPNTPGNYPSQCNVALTGVLLANSHLQNVKSTNWTAGIVFQPLTQASVSLDYYNIKLDNDIVPVFEAGSGFASDISLVRGPTVVLPYVNSSGATVSQATPVGLILEESFPYVNASSTKTSGYDVDLQYHWDMGQIGRFTGEMTWTHELTYQLIIGGATFDLAGTHGPSGVSGDTGNPKDRVNWRLSWTKGPLTITPSINFVSHFSIDDSSSGIPDCASAIAYGSNFPDGVTSQNKQFCNVGYFLETDLYGSYQLTTNFQLHASVTNLFDKQPPVDVQTYGSGSVFLPYDAALHQDGAVGRYFLVGFDYDF
ncbi:MAG: TonB-dependent receptor plug domain-containing protein [Steroidobacteraceae bacterium]